MERQVIKLSILLEARICQPHYGKKFSKDEIISIIENSTNISDLIKNLGYNSERKKTKEQINKMLEFKEKTDATSISV